MKILIKEKLNELNKTTYWLHKESGITYANLSNIINGKTSSIKWDILEKICEALNCTPNDIVQVENLTETKVLSEVN